MLQDIFSAVYGLPHGSQGPLFVQEIYPLIGPMLILATFLTFWLYYYVIGRTTATFNMFGEWISTLLVNAVVCVLTVVGGCRFSFNSWTFDGPVLLLMLIQFVYAIILFTLMSAAGKWWSINARRTPF